MAKFINGEIEEQIRARLNELAGPVTPVYFTQPFACGPYSEQQGLVRNIVALSDRLQQRRRNASCAPIGMTFQAIAGAKR